MIEQSITLASTGAARVSGRDNQLMLGYSPNRNIYRLSITLGSEWEGMTIRALWHTGQGRTFSSLVKDGSMDVPAAITSVHGRGLLHFEGSDGTRVLTSGDIRYSVAANSGTDGENPEPDASVWQQLAALVEQAKKEAERCRQLLQSAGGRFDVHKVMLPASGWTASDVQEYGFQCVVNLPAARAVNVPSIAPEPDVVSLALAAGLCSVCKVEDGKLTFWAQKMPAADIPMKVVLFSPAAEGENTIAALGKAILGRMILGKGE